jgi:hypothetical protein
MEGGETKNEGWWVNSPEERSSSSDEQCNEEEEMVLLEGRAGKFSNLEDEPATSGQKNIGQRIQKHLSLLKQPLPSSDEVDTEGMESYVFLQNARSNNWKKKWAVFKYNPTMGQHCVVFYKDKKSAESNGKKRFGKNSSSTIAQVCFACQVSLSRLELEARAFCLQKESSLSKDVVRIFTPRRVQTLCTTTDEELSQWNALFQKYLQQILDKEAYSYRVTASARLEELLWQKYRQDVERAEMMAKTLDESGFFQDEFAQRDKAGTLELESDSQLGKWKPYRFILKGRYLYYYSSDKGKVASHVIVLKYCTAEPGDATLEDGSCVFSLVTPLVTYVLKAKHKVAMEDWIAAIEKNKLEEGRPKSAIANKIRGLGKSGPVYTDTEDTVALTHDSDPTEGSEKGINPKTDKPYLTFRPHGGKKDKIYKIKKESIKIGRASTNDISIDDSRLSREHARIDTINGCLVFLDLGSKRGSKVNHHMVRDRHLLKPGDIFKVGRTTFTISVGETKV